MLTEEEKRLILSRAYVPEHGIPLMTCLSGGEPFLLEDFFCCTGDDWIIVVGYPIQGNFRLQDLEDHLEKIIRRFQPAYLWLIAPEFPRSYAGSWREKEEDSYYTLPLHSVRMKGDLRRQLGKAGEHLRIEETRSMGNAHEVLSREFVQRANPPGRIRELLFRAPALVKRCENVIVLNAWSGQGELSAFYVVDFGPQRFSVYVIGCHSKRHYVAGASDLLFHEMVRISQSRNKEYIHLGLGVNEGIRRFKMKWGGRPTIPYRMCGLFFRQGFLSGLLAGMGFMKG